VSEQRRISEEKYVALQEGSSISVTICCSGSIGRSGRKLGSCETELIVAGVEHAVEALQEDETI